MKLYEKLEDLPCATTEYTVYDHWKQAPKVACACVAALAEQLCFVGKGLYAIADALKERE